MNILKSYYDEIGNSEENKFYPEFVQDMRIALNRKDWSEAKLILLGYNTRKERYERRRLQGASFA